MGRLVRFPIGASRSCGPYSFLLLLVALCSLQTLYWTKHLKNLGLQHPLAGSTTVSLVVDKGYDKVITWHQRELDDFLTNFTMGVGNNFCTSMQGGAPPTKATLLNITISCANLFERGSGNVIVALYALRLAVRVWGNTNVRMECTDAATQKTILIHPWLMGYFRGGTHLLWEDDTTVGINLQQQRASRSLFYYTRSKMSREQACGHYYDPCPIAHIAPAMRVEFRRMAIALVGVPDHDHALHREIADYAERHLFGPDDYVDGDMQLPVERQPLLPNVELDDAVIHWRCGDLLDMAHPAYSYLKFKAHSRLISQQARSIGIVTQPFESTAQNRAPDSDQLKLDRCRFLVTGLVDFLKKEFPSARISIRNAPTETIALAYARLVLANQTICGMGSTFCATPALAAFGSAFLRSPKGFLVTTNLWVVQDPILPPLDQIVDNFFLMDDAQRLPVELLRNTWQGENGNELVLRWFQDENFVLRQPWINPSTIEALRKDPISTLFVGLRWVLFGEAPIADE